MSFSALLMIMLLIFLSIGMFMFLTTANLGNKIKHLIGVFILLLIFIGFIIFVAPVIDVVRHLKAQPFVSTLYTGTNSLSFVLEQGLYIIRISEKTNQASFSIQGSICTSSECIPVDLHYSSSSEDDDISIGLRIPQQRDTVLVHLILMTSDVALPITFRCFPVK